jgi:hypothetical protein
VVCAAGGHGDYADCAMAGVLTWVCREESEKKRKVEKLLKKGRQNFFDGLSFGDWSPS